MAYCGTLQCWQQTPCPVHECAVPVYRVCVVENPLTSGGPHIIVAECVPQCSLTDASEALQTLSRREWVFDEKSSPSFVTYWLVGGVSRAVLVFRSESSLDSVSRELKALKGFRQREEVPWHMVLPRGWSYEQASEYRVRLHKQPVKFTIAIGVSNLDGSHHWLDPSQPSQPARHTPVEPAKPASIGSVALPSFFSLPVSPFISSPVPLTFLAPSPIYPPSPPIHLCIGYPHPSGM